MPFFIQSTAARTNSGIKQTQTWSISILGASLLLFYLALYLVPLGERPLMIPDETRYAEIPREMLNTADWVVPRLNGLRYFEKPPLGYWVNGIAIAMFDENPFAVRISSALAAGLTSFLVFLFTWRVAKDEKIAGLAALIHMTFLEVYFVGTFNVLDSLFTLFLTGGLVFYYFAAQAQHEAVGHRHYWLLSGFAFGLAFLTKGFLAFALPALVLVPWAAFQKRWRTLLTLGLWVALVAVLVALPWIIMIHLREGDFWHYFFWVEHIKRFSADNAQHKSPFYYFLITFPALAFPWFSLFPAALCGLRSTTEESTTRPSMRLLWLWLLLPFVFFSASNGKLLTYILPCFPPLAVLTALGLSQYLNKGRIKRFNSGILLNTFVFLCLGGVLLASQYLDFGFRPYGDGEAAKIYIFAIALTFGATAGIYSYFATRATIKLMGSLLAIIPLLFTIHFAVPNQVVEHKAPGLLLEQYRARIDKNTMIASDASLVRAVSWYLKRDDVYLTTKGEMEYGLSYPQASDRFLDPQRLSELLNNDASRASILMVCKRSCNPQLENLLPTSADKMTYGVFVLWFTSGTENTSTF